MLTPAPGKAEKCACSSCNNPLPRGRRKWCSDECAAKHIWQWQRNKAVYRDNHACRHCGVSGKYVRGQPEVKLEVNHIVPRGGRGYGVDCAHHLENLETLCHDCHVKVTNAQRIDRARIEFERQQRIFAKSPPPSLAEIDGWLAEATTPDGPGA